MLWDFDRSDPDGPGDGVIDGGSHACRQCGGEMECTRMLVERGLSPIPPIVPRRRWERATVYTCYLAVMMTIVTLIRMIFFPEQFRFPTPRC